MQIYTKRYLPHLTPPGGSFFITSVLKNSLPVPITRKLKEAKALIIQQLEKEYEQYDISKEEYREELIRTHKKHFQKLDKLLDKSANQEHYLKDKNVAKILIDKFIQFDKVYYDLEGYCVMSNHFHLLIDTSIQLHRLPEGVEPNINNYTSLSKIMQLIKGGSAYQINQYLDRKGTFWKEESYDHLVRNEREYFNILNYILNNPIKAKLVKQWENYPFVYSKY